MYNLNIIKRQVKKFKKKLLTLYVLFAIPLIVLLLGVIWFLKPILIKEYCQNQAKKIVGNQWNKLYKAEGYEKRYADQIAWGFREQLKCEHKFQL